MPKLRNWQELFDAPPPAAGGGGGGSGGGGSGGRGKQIPGRTGKPKPIDINEYARANDDDDNNEAEHATATEEQSEKSVVEKFFDSLRPPPEEEEEETGPMPLEKIPAADIKLTAPPEETQQSAQKKPSPAPEEEEEESDDESSAHANSSPRSNHWDSWFAKYAMGSFNSFAAKLNRERSIDDILDGATHAEDAGGMTINEAVAHASKAAEIMAAGQTNSNRKDVPIKPLGVDDRRAIVVAQSMIDRLCSDESDDPDLQHEFEFDAAKLMELRINPMRGLRSAMVGRKREPIGVFVDFSGSCNHVSELFGLIMTGFAYEGATLLIGGNGTVSYVYQPFPNSPMQRYAEDFKKLSQTTGYSIEAAKKSIKVNAGYVLAIENRPLDEFKGHMIACTDDDSYSELIARDDPTHIIYCQYGDFSEFMQRYFEGSRVLITDAKELDIVLREEGARRKTHRSCNTNTTIQLALKHRIYPVNDLWTLTSALAKCR